MNNTTDFRFKELKRHNVKNNNKNGVHDRFQKQISAEGRKVCQTWKKAVVLFWYFVNFTGFSYYFCYISDELFSLTHLESTKHIIH